MRLPGRQLIRRSAAAALAGLSPMGAAAPAHALPGEQIRNGDHSPSKGESKLKLTARPKVD